MQAKDFGWTVLALATGGVVALFVYDSLFGEPEDVFDALPPAVLGDGEEGGCIGCESIYDQELPPLVIGESGPDSGLVPYAVEWGWDPDELGPVVIGT